VRGVGWLSLSAAAEAQVERHQAVQRCQLELLEQYRKTRYAEEDENGECKEPPTTEEVKEYAEYLNFDLTRHPKLKWIAAEAIDAPLVRRRRACIMACSHPYRCSAAIPPVPI
jgi:hypothetical protein